MSKQLIGKYSGEPSKDFEQLLESYSGKQVNLATRKLLAKYALRTEGVYFTEFQTMARIRTFFGLQGLLTVENPTRWRIVVWQETPIRASFASIKETPYQACLDCLQKAIEFNTPPAHEKKDSPV